MYKGLAGVFVLTLTCSSLYGMGSLSSSNTLQEEFKYSVRKYVCNQSNEEAKSFIRETLNNDLKIQYKNLQEDPDGYEDYLSNLDWLLFGCVELANNQVTQGSYNIIKEAISKRQLINCL